MGHQPHPSSDDGEELRLALEFQGLQISVRGPVDRALEFVERLSDRGSVRSAASSAAESLPRSATSGAPSVVETRASIEASFDQCPDHLLALGSSLLATTSGWTPEGRLRRAWRAGNWAGATKSGRVQSPNRTPTIDLPNKFYVVIRGPGIESPRGFKSSRALFAAVGPLEGSSTICHGFPSQAEANVYLAGAGERPLQFSS